MMRIPLAAALILTIAGTSLAAPPATLPSSGDVVGPPAPWTSGNGTSNGIDTVFGPDPVSCPQFWASADYLFWWIKSAPLGPPLLTGDAANNPFSHIETAGGLGDPNTIVLIGDSQTKYDGFSGLRLTAGWAFADDVALEVSGFVLASQSKSTTISSDGSTFLFRPIFNTDTNNLNAGEFLAIAGNFAGSMTVSTSSQLWGTEANVTSNVLRSGWLTVDALAGFRFLQLEEEERIFSASTIIAPFGPQSGIPFNGGFLTGLGDTLMTTERFGTQNRFYGAQAGVRADACWGRLDVAATFKLAAGVTQEGITIAGTTTGVTGGSSTTVPGALLAVASNSGHFSGSDFAVVPEFKLQVGFFVIPQLRAYVGYDFLYCSSVVRPGDQISLRVNDTQVPQSTAFGQPATGPIAPLPPFQRADFWAQGLDLGVEFRF